MPRKPKAFYDARAGCWATSALGEVRHTKDGKGYRTKVFNRELTHRKRDELAAQAWVHAEIEKRQQGMLRAGEITVRQLMEFYLEDQEQALGAEAYKRRVEHLTRFGSWPGLDHPQRMSVRVAGKIAPEDVEPFLADAIKRGNSESYVSDGLLKSLKRLFNWAASVRPGRFPGLPLPSNPLAQVRGPAIRRRAVRDLEPAVVYRFLVWAAWRAKRMSGLKRRFARIALVLLLCQRDLGTRPKELCSARWEDWTLREDGWGLIVLPADRHKTGRKTGKPRIIAVPPRCARRIEWIRNLKGRHPTHIFVHRRGRGRAAAGAGSPWAGEPWVPDYRTGDTKSLQKWFYRLANEARAAGIDLPAGCRLYWLRSSYSTEAQRKGVPRALLAEAMGTSERMLERSYTDLVERDVLDVARAVQGGRAVGG